MLQRCEFGSRIQERRFNDLEIFNKILLQTDFRIREIVVIKSDDTYFEWYIGSILLTFRFALGSNPFDAQS